MKNILFITNAVSMNWKVLDFACFIAGAAHSSLKGIFVEVATVSKTYILESDDEPPCGDILGGSDIMGFETRQGRKDTNIQRFKEYCEKKNIPCSTLCVEGEPMKAVLVESRFADLIIAGAATSAEENRNQFPAEFMKRLLQKAECPLIIAPDHLNDIDEIIFAYDGSASSVFATRQFAQLMPFFEDKKIFVVQVGNASGIKYKRQISDLLRGYYSQIGYKVIDGSDPSYELFEFLRHRDNCMVVMGAYGRAYFSRLFKNSTADPLILLLKVPIFITHC
ncbi:hypothetical protein A8C56_07425 [Niabella ginsenosidivorans]|uniref:UspA domain-containing protein n=1 Tax=Niabella ginsenosidivorans TaxID=1176587 RepID=A0A1A9HZZ0_9BACT|nr:universal stress protein [Niabella ginsenosidivorans]ANH80833.1 hypothetical protein A8C56_07425 [Niabella ginsenosidivorans]